MPNSIPGSSTASQTTASAAQTTRALRLGGGPPGRDHIHIVVRTPNGDDYGKDLLRQHYEQSHHSNRG